MLLKVGRRNHSVTLEANAQHLLTDVWTSVGVVLGVGLVALTGWQRLDPLVALVVAANIIWTGFRIIRSTVAVLMDAALGPKDQAGVRKILQQYERNLPGVEFEALQTRQSGSHKFVSLIARVPGDWTVRRSHKLLELVENDIRGELSMSSVITHLEPSEKSDSSTQAHSDEAADAECDRRGHQPKEDHAQT